MLDLKLMSQARGISLAMVVGLQLLAVTIPPGTDIPVTIDETVALRDAANEARDLHLPPEEMAELRFESAVQLGPVHDGFDFQPLSPHASNPIWPSRRVRTLSESSRVSAISRAARACRR